MTISLERIHEEYCAAKIRSGYKSQGKFREIKRFVDFIKSQGVEHISYKIAMEFQEFRRTTLGRYSLQESYQTIKTFSHWAHLIDAKHEKLPKRRRKINGRRTPVILKPKQVSEIMTAMRGTCKHRPLSAHTYSTLIGLLYVTGMRISEALIELEDADVNLDDLYIYVRASKASRDRYIPITQCTADRLAEYRKIREKYFPGVEDRFFLTHQGKVSKPHAFRKVFANVTADLGYRSKDQIGRIASSLVPHDFRHSFATNSLLRFYEEGLDVKAETPKLTMIMGHHTTKETYYYIQAMPEILAFILRKDNPNAI